MGPALRALASMTADQDNTPTVPPKGPLPSGPAPTLATTPQPADATGPRFLAPTPAELAPHLPQFDVLELLGQGGMGAVYKARQKSLDRLVAIKILPPAAAADPGFAERFTREAKALAKLSHPGIVTVFDSGRAGGFYYFVMEYVDGPNLRSLIKGRHLAPRQVVEFGIQIADALQAAHAQGVVHRDIKPENVLLDSRLRTRVADFGLAKLVAHAPTSTITRADAFMGTPQYMAPEQMDRPDTVTARADLFALGVMLYEMLTGELPIGRFELPSAKLAATDKPVALDPRVDSAVLRALENDPAKRFSSAAELRQALLATLDRRQLPLPVPGPVAAPRRNLKPLLGVGGAVVMVVGMVGLWNALQPVTPAPITAPPPTPEPPAPISLRTEKSPIDVRALGPSLSESTLADLGVANPKRVAQLDTAVKASWRASLDAERAHLKVTTSAAGLVTLAVTPAGDELKQTVDGFRRDVMSFVDEARRDAAALILDRLTTELFPPITDRPYVVTLSKVRTETSDDYVFAAAASDGSGDPVTRQGQSASVIPLRYRPYWVLHGSESAELAETIAEAVKGGAGSRKRIVDRLGKAPQARERLAALLAESGFEAPRDAGANELAGRLEQLARSLRELNGHDDAAPR